MRLIREIINAIFATASLDIFEMDPLTTNEGFAKAEKVLSERAGKKTRKFFPGSIKFASFIRSCILHSLEFRGLPRIESQSIVFLALTPNQYKAVAPVSKLACSRSVLVDNTFWRYRIFPLASFVSLFFWPCGLVRYWSVSRQKRLKGKHHLSKYLTYYGIYFVMRIWSYIYDLKILVLCNDHAGLFSAVNLAVRSQKIPTGYIQHACVASYFPDLTYDYSFLDGLDAANKYNPQPEHGQIFLTGIAKFKPNQQNSKAVDCTDIGVCFNLLDTASFMQHVLGELLNRFPKRRIISRLHPAMSNETADELAKHFDSKRLEFSDASSETSFEFTDRIGIMVCGASSIILEAAMTGTPSVAFFSEHATDVYNFVENGLCEQASSIDELELAIKNQIKISPEELAKKVEYYSAGFTDPQRPVAAELVSNLLDQIATTGGAEFKNWKPHSSFAGNTWEYQQPL